MSIILMKNFNKNIIFNLNTAIGSLRPSSDMSKFKEVLKTAKNIVFLSGAGISAESGIPTFRGAGGLWKKHKTTSLTTPEKHKDNPRLARDLNRNSIIQNYIETATKALPNAGHKAIAEFEKKYELEKKITVITQNVDGLHSKAGTKNLIELHGNMYKTICNKCQEVLVHTDSPIFEFLANRGAPDLNIMGSDIPIKTLPRCKKALCGGLLRPLIVWFGENMDQQVNSAGEAIASCDVCLVIGTSSVTYPAAMFAPQALERGAIVAEFNLETTPATHKYSYYFEGPCGTTLPLALSIKT